jgi:DNA polymerase I-like protein with 3'-5' exonuclease and polymerase domains
MIYVVPAGALAPFRLVGLGIQQENGKRIIASGAEIDEAIQMLDGAEIVMHNGVQWLTAIRRHYNVQPKSLYDTALFAAFAWNDIRSIDQKLRKKGRVMSSKDPWSLEAFAMRIGRINRRLRIGSPDRMTPEWREYLLVALDTLPVLYEKLRSHNSYFANIEHAVNLEYNVAEIIARCRLNGIGFDHARALDYAWQIRSEMDKLWGLIQEAFPPVVKQLSNGDTITIPMNPKSTASIAEHLMAMGWLPRRFNAAGRPVVNDRTLEVLAEVNPSLNYVRRYIYLLRMQRLLETGNEAWLKYGETGRIHPVINTMGAITHRMTHAAPNLTLVPSPDGDWGSKLRSLFVAGEGYKLVGCDASALELRLLAHYLAEYDGGAFAKAFEDDIHTRNAEVLGVDRDTAKRFVYAWIYSASDETLAEILNKNLVETSELRRKFEASLKGLEQLMKRLHREAERGYVIALDKRRLAVRKSYALLNVLLQSAGAIAMKKALVIADERLRSVGKPGEDWRWVHNIHDEWLVEAREEIASKVKDILVDSIREVGKELNVPLDAKASVGDDWTELKEVGA